MDFIELEIVSEFADGHLAGVGVCVDGLQLEFPLPV